MQTKTSTTHSPAATQAATERQGLWLMVTGGVLLGTIGVFVEEAGQHPLVTVWFRCAFGMLALLLWCAATGRMQDLPLGGKRLAVACTTGCLMVLNWTLFFAAMSLTSMAVATVVFHIQPLWVLVFSAIFLRESVSASQWMATPLALWGLALTTGLLDDMTFARPVSSEYLLGLLLCLGASLCYAAVTLLSKSNQVSSPFVLSFWQCGVGTVVLLWVPFALGWPQQASAWAWLAGLGVLHTGLAYVILFAGMARLTFSKIVVLQFVYPLAAVVLDWAIYGTRLSMVQFAGIALMGASLWTIRKPRGQ
nr:DMT family transporter [uncultured Rhodoferax sp.]